MPGLTRELTDEPAVLAEAVAATEAGHAVIVDVRTGSKP